MRHFVITAGLVVLAASPAFAGLALEVEVERAEVDFEAPVVFVARFVNRGTEEIRYFEPLHAGMNTFPDVRFVRLGDGRELRPYDPPFQSMVTEGLQGRVVRLGPGEKKEYRFERARFMAVDRNTQKADWYEPRPLPDGEYEIRATYERHDDHLPFNTGGFDEEGRRVPGIFTGTAWAAPARLRVRPPTGPHLRISVPDRGTTGVVISFANPSRENHVFVGTARFRIDSKMYGGADATIGEGELSVLVPAGGKIDRRIDLRDLSWRRGDGASGPPSGLGRVVPEGVCRLGLSISTDASSTAADGIWVRIPPVPARGLEGVAVTASLAPSGRIRAGQPVSLSVHVENLGDEDVGLVHRLSFPAELVVRIEDATGRRPSITSTTGAARGGLRALRPAGEGVCKVARGLSWDRDRFEASPGLTRKDFVWIEPQAGIVKEIPLSELLATGLVPGRYRVYAGYRNPETGARLGFAEGHRPATGVAWSRPVDLVVE